MIGSRKVLYVILWGVLRCVTNFYKMGRGFDFKLIPTKYHTIDRLKGPKWRFPQCYNCQSATWFDYSRTYLYCLPLSYTVANIIIIEVEWLNCIRTSVYKNSNTGESVFNYNTKKKTETIIYMIFGFFCSSYFDSYTRNNKKKKRRSRRDIIQ